MKNKTKYLYAMAFLGLFALIINGMAYIVTRPQDEDYIEKYASSDKNTLKQSDAESVLQVIHAESFDSAFSHYSTYRDIPDMKFHELRKSYTKARQELFDYINEAAHKTSDVPYYMANYGKKG